MKTLLLTENQAKLSRTYAPHITDNKRAVPMLTNALCFQPMAETYDFQKGTVRDEDGKYMFDKNGKAILERDLAIGYRDQYKKTLQALYPKDWKKVFYHGHI